MSKLPTSRLPVTPSKIPNAPKSGLRPPQQTSTNTTAPQQVSPTGGDSSNNPLIIGDRVTANGKSGTVAFVGSTKFADGEWIGVILDDAQGKNDGSYEGTRYFETEANRGLFCRSAKVQRLVQNGANNSGGDISGSVKAQTTPLINSSKLSTSTSNIDKGDADTTLASTSIIDASIHTNDQTISTDPSSSEQFRVGDRVVVSGTKYGTLKYLGKIHVAEGTWCGIQLDEPLGKNDGSVSGKRYFTCQQRYGLFSPLARVEKVNNDMSQSQIIARKESISSSINNNRPLHRSTSQESLHSNLSEFSTSSNSISRIPTRTPAKHQQQKLSTNTNLYATPNTKSLLTQAAATLAAVTPSSNQIANLVQTIRDKDIFIEKLQSQREQDRLEFSRAAQQVDEMESRMLTFKQQYDIKETENEQLKKEQYQTTQRIEDLEFQLEEYKLTDANKEHSTIPIIPDGYRLLSPKDIEIYQEIKDKILELESINQKLILEKQTLQDEHRQDLKRQNELNENDYKTKQINNIDTIKLEYQTKLNDKDNFIEQIKQEKQNEIDQIKSQILHLQNQETSYEQKFKEQQLKIEQSVNEIQQFQSQLTISQQENETKDKQTDNLLNELKRYQENLVPELEKQCQTLKTELENRNDKTTLALSERESQYEEQIKEYQLNINQAIDESNKIRIELKQLHEENLSKEKQTNDLINTLKQDHEKLQIELNDRAFKTNSTLNERETYYEQQIKDYQIKLEQSNHNIQTIQSELTKLQEENISNQKKSNDTINTLKQDYQILKTEFTELQDRDRTQNMASNERENHYEEQIKDYQTKRDQTIREIQDLRNELIKLQEEKSLNEKELNNLINSIKQDYEKQLNEKDQNFKKEFQDLQTKYIDLQNECQKHSISNEQLKNTNDNIVNEKQALIDQLTKQINDMQQIQTELIEKQINQHSDFERQQIENNKIQEKLFKEKIDQYEKQIQSLKSEYLIETENNNLTHEQEKIRFKNQLQQALQANMDNTNTTNSNGNIKQLEYELNEARYQIEKLEKQIDTNATKDDRTTLEGQINFLNDVIVELRNNNELLKKEIEFQKNPFIGDDEFSQNITTRKKSSAPRLYCDMCEVFDQHDTDDCPKQSSLIDDQPQIDHHSHERVLPPPRIYCEKCEEFDHNCNEVDETY